MGYPPVVVVESGGVPRTQVAEGGSAPAYTVVESGARAITLAPNSPPIALFNPDGSHYSGVTLRIEPSTPDEFFLVLKEDSAGNVVRFERNIGGSGVNDAGVSWPEFRPTGLGRVTAFADDVSTAAWMADEVGAFDLVSRNAGSKFFGSYHGIGSGALNSQSILVNGGAADHTVAHEGSSFELRNSITATDGTDSLTRDMSYIAQSASLLMRINSISASGMSLFYFGMPIATGNGYSEAHVRWGTAVNVIPLGAANANAYLENPEAVRMRDPTTGYYVGGIGELSGLAGYVQCRMEKDTSLTRNKTYFAHFNSAAALANAEFTLEWGATAAGAATPNTNILADALFTRPPWVASTTGGTVVSGSNVGTMTWTSGTSNLRLRCEIPVTLGSRYIASVDLDSVSGTGTGNEWYIGSNSNGSNSSPAPAATRSPDLGRNIMLFTATVSPPEQQFAMRNASTVAFQTVWSDPAVYALAS